MTDWYDGGRSAHRNEVITLELLEGVTKIVFNGFSEYKIMTGITISESVTDIGEYAFAGSGSLTNITIPSSVKNIGTSAFFACGSIESVTMLGEEPAAIGGGVFERCKFVEDNAKGIKVPEGAANRYKEAWTEWVDYIAGGTDDTEEDLIASGTDWTLDKDGKLTIVSQDGITGWKAEENGKAAHK